MFDIFRLKVDIRLRGVDSFSTHGGRFDLCLVVWGIFG